MFERIISHKLAIIKWGRKKNFHSSTRRIAGVQLLVKIKTTTINEENVTLFNKLYFSDKIKLNKIKKNKNKR